MSSPIKTLLVDDQAVFREAMLALLALDSSVEVVSGGSMGSEGRGASARSPSRGRGGHLVMVAVFETLHCTL